ncbi:MAG: RNA polymerase sigma factor [Sedimentisphaerales bacterium]|jgi:RNA polymerase sigma-70 factor (ECF subfamily)|nr:RNA polymerase sigma factor [Sedimentisphaerales bacterium]HNY80127.1 RNA polymerase sigma factor [Sedimentisphaerales bacterium]HOC64153.1 RNA polymerase sigma factor [Sedimentisphaerales bacterium]HOH66613.1 RNA polymerase sigma factor [Sedimentisphaerales bacterium]HQA89877.1 RNA polymerase sigma factor [Sedimentisphaerales bacterium]
MTETMDAGQLSSWYDAHCDRLVLYARNWLPEESAQDVVQGAFVRLMTQKVAPEDVPAWLFRTVRNSAITRLRRRACWSRQRTRLSAEQPPWFESRPEDLIDAHTAQEVLLTLPAEQREVVLLRIWGQLSLKQIGEVVGSPLTTVHSRYKAALTAIRERMEQSCRTPTD